MAIPVEKTAGALATGRPRPLFQDHFRRNEPRGFVSYALHPNGRFLMIQSAEDREQSLVLVLNWRAKVTQAFASDGGASK